MALGVVARICGDGEERKSTDPAASGLFSRLLLRTVRVLKICVRDLVMSSPISTQRGGNAGDFDGSSKARQPEARVPAAFDTIDRAQATTTCLRILEANIVALCTLPDAKGPLMQAIVLLITNKASSNAAVQHAVLSFVKTWTETAVMQARAYALTATSRRGHSKVSKAEVDAAPPDDEAGEDARHLATTNDGADAATAAADESAPPLDEDNDAAAIPAALSCFSLSTEMVVCIQRLAQIERALRNHTTKCASSWRDALFAILKVLFTSSFGSFFDVVTLIHFTIDFQSIGLTNCFHKLPDALSTSR